MSRRFEPDTLRTDANHSQCNAIHKSIVEQFKIAIVYGRSVKHQPQRVGLSHVLEDEDIRKCDAANKNSMLTAIPVTIIKK